MTNLIHSEPLGLYRLSQIVGNKKTTPPIKPLIPVSRSTWWAWCASGKAPKPIKLGIRTTAWRAEDIHAFIQQLGHVT